MAKNIEFGIIIKTRDDGTIKILSSTGKELNKVKKATKSATDQTKFFGNQWQRMAGYAAAYMSLGFARQLLGEADTIGKVAKKLGVSTDALQEYRYAAKIAGVETRTFDMATQRFTRRVGEAAKGTGEAKEALKTLSIVLTDNNGVTRKTEDMLLDVADALAAVKDPAERLRLAFKLFDSEGVAMINMMTKGSDGLKAMREEAQNLNIVMSSATISAAEKATDRFTALGDVLKVKLATGLAAALDVLSPLIKGISALLSYKETWIVAITAISAVLTSKLMPALLATNVAMGVFGVTIMAGLYVWKKFNEYTNSKGANIKNLKNELKDLQSKLNQNSKPILRPRFQIFSEKQKQKTIKRIATIKKEIKALEVKVDTPTELTNGQLAISGMVAGLKSFKEIAIDTFMTVKKSSIAMARGFEDSFVNSLMRGRFEFKTFADVVKNEFNRLMADIIRQQVRAKITKPLFGALMGALIGSPATGSTASSGNSSYADGGYIGNYAGSARSDSQIIAVSGGEYITNAAATAKYLPILEQINKGSFKRFAKGGAVSEAKSFAQGNSKVQINVNVTNNTGGEVKFTPLKPVERADGEFDIGIIAEIVSNINTEKARRGEDPYSKEIANNMGETLDGGAW